MAVNHAQAYEPDRAKNNFAHELADCAAYFQVVAAMPSMQQQKPEVVAAKKRYLDASDQFIRLSATLTSDAVALARLKLALDDMTRTMNKRWENLSLVSVQYRDLCDDISHDPDARLRYWIEKK